MALQIELTPTLDRCIETAARQEFSRMTADYMERGERDANLEGRIELLRTFLESADFGDLRRQSEVHLAQGRSVRFIVSTRGDTTDCAMEVDR